MTVRISQMFATFSNVSFSYDAIGMNVTDTASASDSKLLNLKVANTSMFYVQKDGDVFVKRDMDVEGIIKISKDGGANPNFIVEGDEEQTIRLYNTSNNSNTTTKTSIKFANRHDSDWQFILLNDITEDGSNNFIILGKGISGNKNLFYADSDTGNIGIGTTEPDVMLDVNSDSIRIRESKTPASSSANGVVGEIAWDEDNLYICVANNTWKNANLVSF